MSIRIAVGGEFFDDIRNANAYYVDKTELLYELVDRTDNKVTLFTRPRRFGKTLNLSMMESFFDIHRDSGAVFEGLDITKHKEFCREWMNQYPVLFLSLKDVDGLDFEGAYTTLQGVFADLCKKYAFLLDGDAVDQDDKIFLAQLKARKVQPAALKFALKTLMRMMHTVYDKPVILLIDEYDVPLAKASERDTAENRYYDQMLDVIRGMFSIALKTNEHLEFAVVTGCLRIAKESIFTGTNNSAPDQGSGEPPGFEGFKGTASGSCLVASYSVLDDRFSDCFGFTQKEVEDLLLAADLPEKNDVFRSWYDGYVFGSTPVYCPWDVTNYCTDTLTIKPMLLLILPCPVDESWCAG